MKSLIFACACLTLTILLGHPNTLYSQTDRGKISGTVAKGEKKGAPVLEAIVKFTMERSPTGFRRSTKSLPPDGRFAEEMPQGWTLVNAFKKEADGTILAGNARVKVDTNLGATADVKMAPQAGGAASLAPVDIQMARIPRFEPSPLAIAASLPMTIVGNVSASNSPVAATLIISSADSGDELAFIQSSVDGRYALKVDPGQDYLINVIAPKYRPASYVARVSSDGQFAMFDESARRLTGTSMVLEYDLPGLAQLPADVNVEGTVSNGQSPVSAVILVTNTDTGDELPSIAVGDDGKYTIALAPGHDFLFNIVRDRYEPLNFIVRVDANRQISATSSEGAALDFNNIVLTAAKDDASNENDVALKLDTRTLSRSFVFRSDTIEALPLSGIRNIDSLALLVPGVSPAPAAGGQSGPSFGPTLGTAGQFAVNGLRSRENNFTVDGSDNNDEEVGVRRQGFLSPFPQSPESIEEFQLITANAEAEFGHTIGGQLSVLTKYGQSRFHGMAFGFLTGTPLNARNFFNMTRDSYPSAFHDLIPLTSNGRLDGTPVRFTQGAAAHPTLISTPSGLAYQRNPLGGKDSNTRAQTGFTVGGPIAKNTFIFGSYERLTVHASRQLHFSVPTVEERGFLNCNGGCLDAKLPFAAGRATSPDGDAVFSLFPFPNNPLGPYGPNTFTQTLPADGLANVGSLKLDRQFNLGSTSHIFTARHNIVAEQSVLPATGGAIFSSVKPRLRTNNFAMFFTSTFTNSLSNTFRASFGRTTADFAEARNPILTASARFPDTPFLLNAPLLMNVTQPGDPFFRYVAADSAPGNAILKEWKSDFESFYPTKLGPTADTLTGAVGEMFISGFSRLGVDASHLPQKRANDTTQIASTASYSAGRNQLTFGIDIRRRGLNSTIEKNVRPSIFFPSLPIPEGTRVDLPAPLLRGTTLAAAGKPGAIFQTYAFGPNYLLNFPRKEMDLFAQNRFRIAPNLHAGFGMRFGFNKLPEQADESFKQAYDRTKLEQHASDAVKNCQTFFLTVFENQFAADGCGAAIETLVSSFPTDFKQAFGGDWFSKDFRAALSWSPGTSTVLRGGFGTFTGSFPTIIANESRNPFPSFLTLQYPASIATDIGGLQELNSFLTDSKTLNTVVRTSTSPDKPEFKGPEDAVFLLGYLAAFGDQPIVSLVQPAANLKSPYARQFSGTIEQLIGTRAMFSVSYVGTTGKRLLRISTPTNGVLRSQPRLVRGRTFLIFPAQADVPDRPQRPPDPVGAIPTRFQADSESNYHSLQAELRMRFAGLNWNSAFTYSHAIDDASDLFDLGGNFALPQNSISRSERGDSSFDVPLRAVNHFIWDLPFKGSAVRGWQVAGIYTLQSGQPFTVNSAVDWNHDGNLTDRLNTTAGLVEGTSGREILQLTVDPASLVAPIGRNGSVGRNTFRAKGINNLDVVLSRRFSLRDGRELRLRAEVFNVFNRTHFAIPVRILEAPAFGSSVSTSMPPRNIQFAVKYAF